jgi:hypothetical protein
MLANMMAFLKNPERAYRLLALTALGVGLLVYLLDRSPAHLYVLSRVAWWISSRDSRLGTVGGSLPGLVHVYGLLLLAAAVMPRRPALLPVHTFGFLLDTPCEHPLFAPRIAAGVSAWLQQAPFLANPASYFLHGPFNYADLVAGLAGTVFACGSIVTPRKRSRTLPP